MTTPHRSTDAANAAEMRTKCSFADDVGKQTQETLTQFTMPKQTFLCLNPPFWSGGERGVKDKGATTT